MSKVSWPSSPYSFMNVVHSNGEIGFYNNVNWYFSATGLVPTGKWTLCTWTYDGTNMRGYVNGVLVHTQATSIIYDVNDLVRIGSWYGSSNSYDLNGKLRDARVWDRDISSQST